MEINFWKTLDHKIFFAVHHLQDFQLNLFLAWPTYLGSQWTAVPCIALLSALQAKGKRGRVKATLLRPLPLVLNHFLVEVLKNLFQRPRPFTFFEDTPEAVHVLFEKPTTFSFPSGHAVTAFSAAVILNRCFKVPAPAAYGLALWISLSRLYVGVHFPSDILAGAFLGVLLTPLWLKIFRQDCPASTL